MYEIVLIVLGGLMILVVGIVFVDVVFRVHRLERTMSKERGPDECNFPDSGFTPQIFDPAGSGGDAVSRSSAVQAVRLFNRHKNADGSESRNGEDQGEAAQKGKRDRWEEHAKVHG